MKRWWRLIQQASRRVKRTAEDQALMLALQNQVETEHSRAARAGSSSSINSTIEELRETATHRSLQGT